MYLVHVDSRSKLRMETAFGSSRCVRGELRKSRESGSGLLLALLYLLPKATGRRLSVEVQHTCRFSELPGDSGD